MTKVARLFEEEKIEAVNEVARLYEKEKMEAVNKAVSKTHREAQLEFARKLLLAGVDYLKIMEYTGLTRVEVEQIQISLGA